MPVRLDGFRWCARWVGFDGLLLVGFACCGEFVFWLVFDVCSGGWLVVGDCFSSCGLLWCAFCWV